MTQLFVLISLSILTCGLAVFALYKAIKTCTVQQDISTELGDIKDKMSEMMWEDKAPYVRYSYNFNKSREHQFEIEIINILDESITILDLMTYPRGEKLSYSEVAFPSARDLRPERLSYNDKITLERAKTPLNLDLNANQRYLVKYTLKFKDAVFTGRKPQIFLSYQSALHPEIKEIRISEMENFGIKPVQIRTAPESRISQYQ